MNTFYQQAYDFLVSREHIRKGFLQVQKTDEQTCTIKYKDATKKVVINQEIAQPQDNWIVCANTKKNVDTLIHNWQKYAEFPNATIIFLSNTTNWSIKPHVHAKITTQSSLEKGIYALFANA